MTELLPRSLIISSIIIVKSAAFCLLLSTSAQADSKMIIKTELQATMQGYIDDHLNEGSFLYMDPESGALHRIKPLGAHPMILHTDSYFILCTDFRSDSGEKLNVDFFVARTNSGYLIFHHAVEQRGVVKKLVKSGIAKKYN